MPRQTISLRLLQTLMMDLARPLHPSDGTEGTKMGIRLLSARAIFQFTRKQAAARVLVKEKGSLWSTTTNFPVMGEEEGSRRICCFTLQPDKCVQAFNRTQKKYVFSSVVACALSEGFKRSYECSSR